MFDKTAQIVANEQLTPSLWKLTLSIEEIPSLVQPGQFVHLQLGEKSEFILRRPLSVYNVRVEREHGISHVLILYQVVGKGTEYLAMMGEGVSCKALGPVGRGWQPPHNARKALLIGGGVGWAPLQLLAERLHAQGIETHALIGAQNKETLTALTGGLSLVNTYLATDDGSAGHHGFTTDVLPELLGSHAFDYIATCGPEPMQKKVALLTAEAGVTCEVSLERRMACGLGACLGCAVNTVHGTKRACVDGPVFNAQEVCW